MSYAWFDQILSLRKQYAASQKEQVIGPPFCLIVRSMSGNIPNIF